MYVDAPLPFRAFPDAPPLSASDPDFEAKVRDSFGRQSVMALFGARLLAVEPGLVALGFDYRADLAQQHGYLHAGVTSAIADSAGGYAAFTLMPAGSSVLTLEYKVNLLAPAAGETFVARGRVVKAGSRISVCEIDVTAIAGERRTTCLFGLQTVMRLPGQADGPERTRRE